MSRRVIEMQWVCSTCGTRNLGRHKVCQRCGDPKDASEPWLMPGETRGAPSVTDPTLLRQADAGADWQCGYCGSHQKRLDGRCAQCGAAQTEGARVPHGGVSQGSLRWAGTPAQHSRLTRPAGARGAWSPPRWMWMAPAGAAAVLTVTCLACIGLGAILPTPIGAIHKERVTLAEVRSLGWRHEVAIERYRVVGEEGFAEQRPQDALEIRSLGQRHHHDERVFDHFETESYTEQVPYQDTETYTDREPCGEDCTERPQSCHEVCTPNDNGFASCHTVCSGGGRDCSPRYCSVTRTRPVTRYRTEHRTRQVERFRYEPRDAEAFAWRVWRWRPDRVIDVHGGASEAPHWPAGAELAPAAPLGPGERERSERRATYRATLAGAGRSFVHVPRDLAEYERVRAATRWYVRDDGSLLKPWIPPGRQI